MPRNLFIWGIGVIYGIQGIISVIFYLLTAPAVSITTEVKFIASGTSRSLHQQVDAADK